jgi:hypothetical protein
MHPRVPDRAGLLGTVELGAVVCEQSVIAPTAGIGKQETILTSPSLEILNVIHLMLAEQPTQGLDELDWNVFIEQELHRTIKHRPADGSHRHTARTQVLPEWRAR